jgi:hypothetical protein
VGKCLTVVTAANQVADILVDLAGNNTAALSPAPVAPPPPSNRAPTANAGANETVNAGARVTLAGSGSDPDTGDTLTYRWTQVSGTTVSLSSTSVARPTFTAPSSAGTLTFRLTVTDNHGGSNTDDVTVSVRVSAPATPAARFNTGDHVIHSTTGNHGVISARSYDAILAAWVYTYRTQHGFMATDYIEDELSLYTG